MNFNPFAGQYEGGTTASDTPPGLGLESSPTTMGQIQNAMPTMDARKKKVLQAMLMKMAQPNFQYPPAFQPSNPFRYYPQ